MKLSRRWAIGAGVVIVIFFAARWMSWNRLRPVIAWGTRTFSGIEISIRGDLDVLPHGDAKLEAENIRITDRRDHVARGAFLEIERFSTTWHLPALRAHDVTLKDTTIGTTRLYLDRFASGEDDARQDSAKEAEPSDWKVHWEHFVVPSFILLRGDRSVVDLSGTLEGRMTLDPLEVSGKVDVKGKDLRRTLAAFDYPMTGQIARYRVTGDVRFTPDRLEIAGLEAKLQDSDARGKLDLAFSPVAVKTFLHFSKLEFKDLGAFVPKKMQEELPSTRLEAARPSLYSQAPISTDWLRGPRLDIQAKVDQFAGDGKASLIHSFDLTVKVGDGKAEISVPRSSIMGGNVRADLSLAAVPAGMNARLAGTAHEMRTGRVFQEFLSSNELKKKKFGKLKADEIFQGQMDAFLDVAGRGESMSAIMATLDGEAGIYVGEGKVSSLLVEILGLDLTESVGVLLARNQTVAMQCAVVGAKAKDGVLTFDPAYVSTSDSDLLAKGELDLKNEEAKLELRTYPKDPSLGSLRTPIKLSGQLVDPRVRFETKDLAGRLAIGIALGLLNPAAALLATIEPGNAPARSCEEYRAKLLRLRNAH